MSRRRSDSSAMMSSADRDVVMGPPPVPGSSSAPQPKLKDGQEISEKYRKLKRRFFELEEKHKETSTELQRSGERNVKMREERNILLDRIIELESESQPYGNGRSSASPPSTQPSSSAFPRTMLNPRARTSFVANLRDADAEDPADDDLDPIPTSRHLASEARRRGDDDPRERYDEDSRDPRNGDRRSRTSLPHQGSASPNSSTSQPTGSGGALQSSSRSSAERMTSPGGHHATASSSSSSSHGHSRHSPLPGNPSNSLLYAHPSSHLHDQQHHLPSSQDRQPSSTPERVDSRTREDVDMADDRGYDHNLQPNSAGSSRRDRDHADRPSNGDSDQNGQPQDNLFKEGDANNGPSSPRQQEPTSGPSRSPRRSTRVAANHDREPEPEQMPKTRGAAKRGAPVGGRKTRSESAALAAAAAAAKAEAQAEAAKELPQPAPASSQNSTHQEKSPATNTTTASSQLHSAAATRAPADPNIDPALAGVGLGTSQFETGSTKESSPMDNIVKVAEAAIAAQKAANAAQNASGSHPNSASPAPFQTQPTATASSSSSASPASYNPYMITTQMVPGKPTINTMGMASPPGMMPLGMNPYAMYYPPGTPVTPGTPSYPPYNPYYYMAGPAPPNGMHPTSPNFVPPSAQRPPSEVQRHAKPKRLKAHTVTSKNFSIPMVPRDKRGKPMLPLNVGIMTVINLGEVCMREHFHTERYIFPVGYEVTRRYLSTVDPNVEVVYHCTILDGGDGPKFQIVPSDVPDRPVIAGTATGAWSSIVKQANAIRNRQHSNSVSGPDFFGLGQNTIKHLIQELPNANRLRDYVWQTFIEGGPLGGRHAAVIPALPEEYDAAMPIGAYYPTDRDKRRRESTGTPETPSPKGLAHYPQHIIAQAEAQRAQQQALQQAQQMGAQPLKAGESSGLQQSNDAMQPPNQQGGTSALLLPLNNSGPASFQEYRPQLVTSADRTLQASAVAGLAGLSQDSSRPNSVPATFASIMNAYPTSGVPGAPPPIQ